jgi:hypothetical protein
MNSSALNQVGRNWSRVLGAVEYLRKAYVATYCSNEEGMTLLEFGRMAFAGLQLPAYLLFRGPHAPELGSVPVFVSSVHKVLAGIFGASKNMLISQAAMGASFDKTFADPYALADFAEGSGMLVGHTGTEVCAGPPRLIEEILRLFVTGDRASKTDPDAIYSALPNPAELFEYARGVGDISLWQIALALRTRELLTTFTDRLIQCHGLGRGSDTWLRSAVAKLRTFHVKGFSAQSLPPASVLDLEASEVMIRGLLPLFRDLRPEEMSGPVFRRTVADAEQDGLLLVGEVSVWLSKTDAGRGWDASALSELAVAFARAVRVEQDGLSMFSRFQKDLHRALGRLPPIVNSDSRTIGSLFGQLPSEFLGEMLGIYVRTSGAGGVLTDGSRTIYLP